MNFADLKGKKVGISASGGLVSLFITQRLKEEAIDYEQFIVDIGQPGEEGHSFCAEKIPLMQGVRVIDLKGQIAATFLEMIRAQAQYDGGYWNTTGVARAVTVKGLVEALRASNCNVLAHGAVHGGNDEFRFTYYLKMFAPEIIPFSPWQDPTTTVRYRNRGDMSDSVLDADESMLRDKALHSIDANLGGVSHESRDIEVLANSFASIAPIMGVRITEAPDQGEASSITFERGLPVAINGEPVTAYQAVSRANLMAGRNGVVLKSVLENRMNGTKGRGLYESPGLDLLGTAVKHLLQATVDKDSWELIRCLSPFIARQTYAGRLYDPATQAALATIAQLTDGANGTVDIVAFKGNHIVERVRDYTRSRFTAQQFRFAHSGQKWITEIIN